MGPYSFLRGTNLNTYSEVSDCRLNDAVSLLRPILVQIKTITKILNNTGIKTEIVKYKMVRTFFFSHLEKIYHNLPN